MNSERKPDIFDFPAHQSLALHDELDRLVLFRPFFEADDKRVQGFIAHRFFQFVAWGTGAWGLFGFGLASR